MTGRFNDEDSEFRGPYQLDDVTDAGEPELELTPVQQFYGGKNVLITGATGFLGRILVEKLLRSCPTIGTLYLLVRPKKGKSLDERLEEMFEDAPFASLRRVLPKFRHKVVGVAGDCAAPDLGINDQDRCLLQDEVGVVFHVAATVRFDEKLQLATAINVRSVRDILRLSRKMPRLAAFVHVSTIYANCVHESIDERVYPPALDPEQLIQITQNLPAEILEKITPDLVGRYPNTYTLTKQVGEGVVLAESAGLPVAIFRPAIVVSTYREPLVAWINNLYGPTGVVAATGVGLLRALHCDSHVNANIVPVDMCVNSLIVSACEVAGGHAPRLPVYNYGSTSAQPITWAEFRSGSLTRGLECPTVKAVWYISMHLYKHYATYWLATLLLHVVPALLVDAVCVALGKPPRLLQAYRKIHRFAAVIAHFARQQWAIESAAMETQQHGMTARDRRLFFCDLKQLDWADFFRSYAKGIRVYLLQDPMDTLPAANARFRRLYYAHQAVKGVALWALVWVVWRLLPF